MFFSMYVFNRSIAALINQHLICHLADAFIQKDSGCSHYVPYRQFLWSVDTPKGTQTPQKKQNDDVQVRQKTYVLILDID